jgi:hypothetical protein
VIAIARVSHPRKTAAGLRSERMTAACGCLIEEQLGADESKVL